MVTSNGSSPLTVRGLDPGMIYSVTINVFDGNRVVLRGRVERKTITVIGVTVTSGKIHDVYEFKSWCIVWFVRTEYPHAHNKASYVATYIHG